jgi:hypothetical protein
LKRLLVIVLCLMATGSWGHTLRTLTSLPYTAVANDSIEFSGTKLSTSGSGITIGVSGVIVNLGTDTLQFGTGNTSDVYGIYINNVSNVQIVGGVILGGNTTDTVGSYRIRGIRIDGWVGNNSSITGTKIVTGGINSYCIGGNYSGYGLVMDALDLQYRGLGFTNRYAYATASGVLWLSPGGGFGATPPNVNFTIQNSTIYSHAWGVIVNAANAKVLHNSITIDRRNELWTNATYDGNDAHSRNGNGINCYYFGAGTTIRGNTIRAGTSYYGSDRGITTELAEGTEAYPIRIDSNDVDVHGGFDYGYGWSSIEAYKARSYHHWVYVTDNKFTSTACDTPGTSYGINAWAVTIAGLADYTATKYGHFYFERNHCVSKSCKSCNETPSAWKIGAIRFGTSSWPYVSALDSNIIFRNNYFESPYRVVAFGDEIVNGARLLTMQGDTFASTGWATTDSAHYNFHTFESGESYGADPNCTDNVVRDAIYLGRASDTATQVTGIDWCFPNVNDKNIGWDAGAASASSFFSFERTLKVYVRGNNGLPVIGAKVIIKNGKGIALDSSYTSPFGLVSKIVRYQWVGRDFADTLGYGGSPTFNPFVLKAAYANDSIYGRNKTVTRTIAGGVDTLTLANTVGFGSWTGPVISGVGSSAVTTTTATISWTTDIPADSRVEYGTTVGYGLSQSNVSLVTSHSITLTNLPSGTLIYYRVASADINRVETIIGGSTFTTL